MCGRYQQTATPEAVRALFGYVEWPNFPPRTAIAQSEPISIVHEVFGVRHHLLVRWGFMPRFVKDPGTFPLLFNARGETVAEKPAFRNALRRRRCLVPATGFYEWRRDGEGRAVRKTPFLCERADGAVMALAGVWETYVAPDGSEVDTAAILTTAANGVMAAIHERMPVIIEPADFETWLDCRDEDPAAALGLVRPAGEEVLVLREVDAEAPRPLRQARPRPAAPAPPKARDDPQGSLF
ncbi:MAG: SOS response-associated peptidase [Alsobacter sp.]